MSQGLRSHSRAGAAAELRSIASECREGCAEAIPRDSGAFSLIEVIAAVAVFAIGMIAVLGLFIPVTKSVATVTDVEIAARVADAVRAQLEAMSFADAAALIQLPADVQAKDADPRYSLADTAKSSRVIFATVGGEAAYFDANATPPNWYAVDHSRSPPRKRVVPNADKFFEIDLIRNETLSPVVDGAQPVVIAYIMRVRWPAYVRTSPSAAAQTGQTTGGAVGFDQSRKQMMYFTGAIRR